MLITIPPEIPIRQAWNGNFNQHLGASEQMEL